MYACTVIISGILLYLVLFDCCVNIPKLFFDMVSLVETLALDVRTYILNPGCIHAWTVVLFIF